MVLFCWQCSLVAANDLYHLSTMVLKHVVWMGQGCCSLSCAQWTQDQRQGQSASKWWTEKWLTNENGWQNHVTCYLITCLQTLWWWECNECRGLRSCGMVVDRKDGTVYESGVGWKTLFPSPLSPRECSSRQGSCRVGVGRCKVTPVLLVACSGEKNRTICDNQLETKSTSTSINRFTNNQSDLTHNHHTRTYVKYQRGLKKLIAQMWILKNTSVCTFMTDVFRVIVKWNTHINKEGITDKKLKIWTEKNKHSHTSTVTHSSLTELLAGKIKFKEEAKVWLHSMWKA